MKLIRKLFNCYMFGWHEWTCNADKGIPATKEQIHGGLKGFNDYAKMYCGICGKVSKLSK